ncbi:hypothetical protein [Shewanella woodyi]|uniref:hypothetical protein n=1 Tax=Shewanella woodyi TaxID=60961 RepID=UPI003747DF2C
MNQTLPHNPLTRFITDNENCWSIEQYQNHGGYQGFRKSLTQSQEQLLDTLKESNLRGRGGAGFPTGLKWSFVPRGDDAPSPVISSLMPMRWSLVPLKTECLWRKPLTRSLKAY